MNHKDDPESRLMPNPSARGKRQKKFGKSFKHFDHLISNLHNEVRLPGIPPSGDLSSMLGSNNADRTTRRTEVTLTTIGGSLENLTFGNAVRAGKESEVIRLLSENSLDLLVSEVSFDIILDIDTRLTPPIVRRHSTIHRMQSEVNSSNTAAKSQHGFMTVTPFHLGLLAQRRHIINIMLEKVLEENDPQAQFQWMKKILECKTTLQIPDDAVPCDKGTLSLDGMNAFHVAARYDPKALKDILELINDKQWMENLGYLLEQKDSKLQQTPLHIAAKNATPEVARLLLDNGANVDALDYQGFTPLHIASKIGNEDICTLLLERNAKPNIPGHRGKTPLHKAKHPKIVQLLVQNGANPYAKMKDKGEPEGLDLHSCFDTYIERNSDCSKILLDECVATNGQDLDSSDLLVIYDLDLFRHESKRDKEDEEDDEIAALSQLVSLKLYNLLEHPLSEVMLHLKWQCIKKLYWVKFYQYALFVVALTVLAYMQANFLRTYDEKQNKNGFNIQDTCLNSTFDSSCYFQPIFNETETWRMGTFFIFYVFVALNTIFLIIREALECIYCWKHYGSKEDFLEISLLICTAAYLISIFASPRLVNLHLSVWSVFLAWIELNLLLGRFPSIGIYIHMFTNVFNKLLLFIMVYSPVLIAFSLAFNLLLPYKQSFDSPLLKILAMMIGEFEYSTFLFFEDGTLRQDKNAYITTQALFLLFVMFVSIVIGNLLVALTVSEIGVLTKEGEVIGLEKMALQIVALEDIFINKPTITDCLPSCLEWIETTIKKKTRVFERLKRQHTDKQFIIKPSHYNEESTKICVRPFEPIFNHSSKKQRTSIRSKNRVWASICSFLKSFIYPSDREGSLREESGNALYAEYDVYLYDDNKGTISDLTDFKVPKSSVKRALKLLKDREEQERKLAVSKAILEKQQENAGKDVVIPTVTFNEIGSSGNQSNMSQMEMIGVIDDMIRVMKNMKESIEFNKS